MVEAGDEAEDGGFAAPGGSEEDAEFADVFAFGGVDVFDLEVDVAEGLDELAGGGDEAAGDIAEGDFGLNGHDIHRRGAETLREEEKKNRESAEVAEGAEALRTGIDWPPINTDEHR
jgi:hypothetical protein